MEENDNLVNLKGVINYIADIDVFEIKIQYCSKKFKGYSQQPFRFNFDSMLNEISISVTEISMLDCL